MSDGNQPQTTEAKRYVADETSHSAASIDRYRLQLETKIATARRANDTVLVGMLKEQLADLDSTVEDPDSSI